ARGRAAAGAAAGLITPALESCASPLVRAAQSLTPVGHPQCPHGLPSERADPVTGPGSASLWNLPTPRQGPSWGHGAEAFSGLLRHRGRQDPDAGPSVDPQV